MNTVLNRKGAIEYAEKWYDSHNPDYVNYIETNLLLKAIKSYLKKDEWDLLIALVILNIPVTKLSKIYNVSIQAIYQKRKRIQQKIKNICS